jgi:hypothetical protein
MVTQYRTDAAKTEPLRYRRVRHPDNHITYASHQMKSKVSTAQVSIVDGGVRRKAWDAAAKKAGLNRQQWILSVLDDVLTADVRAKLPPLTGPGSPRSTSQRKRWLKK